MKLRNRAESIGGVRKSPFVRRGWIIASVVALVLALGVGSRSLAAAPATPSRVSSPTPSREQQQPPSGAGGTAATPAINPAAKAAAALPQATAPNPQAETVPTDRHALLSYLGQVIGWARGQEAEEALAREPAETLFVADDRQMASEVVNLAFQYARAAAALLRSNVQRATSTASGNATAGGEPAATAALTGASPLPGLDALLTRRGEAQGEVATVKARLKDLSNRIAHAVGRKRDNLNSQLASAQGELDLAQSRLDSLEAMIDFESGSSAARGSSTGLDAQIDELERSAPQAVNAAKPAVAAEAATMQAATPVPSGIFERAANLTALRRESGTLNGGIRLTEGLLAFAARMRTPLVQSLHDIDQRAHAMTAEAGAGDITTVRKRKADFAQLTQEHKLVVAALLPLSKQMVILDLYRGNLGRWRAVVDQRFNQQLKSLLLHVLGLVIVLLGIFVGALIWRKLTFRYVQELERRHRLLQLRRFVVGFIVILVLLFDFANELSTFATVLGFAAAGIAVTLQNVILSIAGYFYISGRFGIRTGDRVQISGITGDVLEIGFFKMTLMELSSGDYGHQPTGRAVIFPNSVVFQQNGNFFRQLPGTNSTWNELHLTLAPDCDYRLAEKRLVEVVNEVYARYRDRVQREYRGVEQELNMRIETPRPQSRLYLNATGIEMVIRYPAQLQNALQTSDEIARRLVDAIKREPGLKLVATGTPAIQAAPLPAAPEDAAESHQEKQPGAEADGD